MKYFLVQAFLAGRSGKGIFSENVNASKFIQKIEYGTKYGKLGGEVEIGDA